MAWYISNIILLDFVSDSFSKPQCMMISIMQWSTSKSLYIARFLYWADSLVCQQGTLLIRKSFVYFQRSAKGTCIFCVYGYNCKTRPLGSIEIATITSIKIKSLIVKLLVETRFCLQSYLIRWDRVSGGNLIVIAYI